MFDALDAFTFLKHIKASPCFHRAFLPSPDFPHARPSASAGFPSSSFFLFLQPLTLHRFFHLPGSVVDHQPLTTPPLSFSCPFVRMRIFLILILKNHLTDFFNHRPHHGGPSRKARRAVVGHPGDALLAQCPRCPKWHPECPECRQRRQRRHRSW